MSRLPQDLKFYFDSKALRDNEEFGNDANSKVVLLKFTQKQG